MTIPNKDTTPHKRRMDALQSLLAATKLTISSSEQAPPTPSSKGKEPVKTARLHALQQKERIMAELAMHKAKLDELKQEHPNILQIELERSTEYGKAVVGPEQESLMEDIKAHVEHYQFGLETVGAALDYIREMYVKGVDEMVGEEGSGSGKGAKDQTRDSRKREKNDSRRSGKSAKDESRGSGKGVNDESHGFGKSVCIPTGPRRR